MRKPFLFLFAAFILLLISSCGVYEHQCPGVASVDSISSNS